MMAHTRPEMTEGQMEAYFDFIVKSRGCGHAFATVAATGKNACILHYSANRDRIKEGDLVLVDLGQAGNITVRMSPVPFLPMENLRRGRSCCMR